MKLLIEEIEENPEQLAVTIEGDVLQVGFLHFEATQEIIKALRQQDVKDSMISYLLSKSLEAINELGGKNNG